MLLSSFLYLDDQRPPFLIISHRRKRGKRAISSKLVEIRASPRSIQVMKKPWRRAPERVSKMRHVGSVDRLKKTSDRESWLNRRKYSLSLPWRQHQFGKNRENIKEHQTPRIESSVRSRLTNDVRDSACPSGMRNKGVVTERWSGNRWDRIRRYREREIESGIKHYPFFPRLKGESYEKNSLWICLFVCVRVKRTSPTKKLNCDSSTGGRGNCIRELESEIRLPRNAISRPGINGNRVHRKHILLRYVDEGNMNSMSKYLRNRIDQSKTNGSRVHGILLLYPRSIASLMSHIRISSRNRSEGELVTRISRTKPEWRPGGALTNN